MNGAVDGGALTVVPVTTSFALTFGPYRSTLSSTPGFTMPPDRLTDKQSLRARAGEDFRQTLRACP